MAIFSLQDFVYLGLSFATIYVINFYVNYFRRPDRLPGPIPLPIIGNLHQYRNDLSVWGKWLQRNYGDFGEVWFGSKRAIWIGRTDYLEKIFKPSPGNYNARAVPNEALEVLDMGFKGIGLNRDYHIWHNNRKYFTKAISSPLFLRLSVKFTQSLFMEMENYWEDLMRRNVEIDLANWMIRFFAEAIFLITTSKKSYAIKNHYEILRSPKKNSADTEYLVNHVRAIFRSFEFFLTTPKFMYMLPSYDRYGKKLIESFDWMRNYYLPNIIKERREEIESSPIEQELTPDMLTMMLTFNTPRDVSQSGSVDEDAEPMSNINICENLFEVVVGGIDTSTNTFCYTIYYLCKYPKVKQRLFEEIQQVFGTNSKFDVKYEELSKLHYCEAVIKEVTRFKTLAPFVFRMGENPDDVNGHKFEGETQIFINAQEVHMNKAYWKDPEKFDPERFLPNNEIKPNSYLAFGGGMRICPGRNLAMAELKTLLVLFLSRYNVELTHPSAPLKTHCTIANHCEELKVKLVRINN